jgi:two-component system CheB/CheR fusion protein
MTRKRLPAKGPSADERQVPPSREEQLERLLHDLEVHHEELTRQQAQLVDSQRALVDSQRALEEARDRYAELFDFAPISYVVVDTAGMIREANLSMSRMVNTERRMLIGSPLFVHIAPPDRLRVMEHLARCRRGEGRVETEVTLCPRGGPSRPVQLASAPALSSGGGENLFHTAIIDLSERQRMEEERTRARDEQQRLHHEESLVRAASDAKDRFLAMLSHELRTPLTPILFALDALKSRRDVPAPLVTTLDMVRRNVLLETRLIDDLLDMTRIVQGRMSILPEVIDAHDLVNDVVVLCRDELRNADIALTMEPGAVAHHVCADPVRFQQVLWNLLRNAIRNTPPGGQIGLHTTNSMPGWFSLTVSDSGRGIEPERLAAIFTFFEQDDEARKRGVGLGLGLAISKAIVELHGGRISAASDGLGSGATFQVELPTVFAPTAGVETARHPPPATRYATTILLVEDNEDSAAAMAELLRLHGYAVNVAACVRDALRLAEQSDVLVSDIALPDGTGHDLMRELSARQQALPAIALSGYGTSEDIRRSAEAGFEHHIVKPVEPSRLLEAIEALRLARITRSDEPR